MNHFKAGDEIPDGELLFRYILPEKIILPEGQTTLPTNFFEDGDLSCDWQRHCPNPSLACQYVELHKTFVIAIEVCNEIKNPANPKNSGKVEEAWRQKVLYDPVNDTTIPCGINLAHAVIRGKKKLPVKEAIANHSRIYLQS
jgi:hypothetical protein